MAMATGKNMGTEKDMAMVTAMVMVMKLKRKRNKSEKHIHRENLQFNSLCIVYTKLEP